MSYYWCWNTNNYVYSTSNPKLDKSTFIINPTFEGKSFNVNEEYRSTYTSISTFRKKQRFTFGNGANLLSKNNIHIYYASTTSFYNNMKLNLVNDITDRFTINVISNTIVDITPLSTVSGSNLTIVIDFDNELGSSIYKITPQFENCTLINGTLDGYVSGSTFSLEIASDTGYKLPDTISYSSSYITDLEYTLNEDKTTATITGIITGNATISVAAILLHYVSITGTFKNCTCNYSDGDILIDNTPILITPKENYEFNGYYKYKTGLTTHSVSPNENGVLLIGGGVYDTDYILNDNYIATKTVEKISNFANLFYTNNDELALLSKARFVSTDSGTVDYGSFIVALYLLPFPIDTRLLSEEKSHIILGNYDSNVESTRLITYKTEIDGGTITIPEKYKNVYDFLNTECILHLPHFNKMHINTEYVIGQTLTIKYIIDLYTGNVTANVYSTFVNDIIETQTQLIAENIPFIQKQNNSVVGTISNINKNAIETAYIEIVRNIPYYANDIFGKATIVYDTVGSVTGYCEISDIQLITTATNDEKEEIETLLKNGIFIKESEV